MLVGFRFVRRKYTHLVVAFLATLGRIKRSTNALLELLESMTISDRYGETTPIHRVASHFQRDFVVVVGSWTEKFYWH